MPKYSQFHIIRHYKLKYFTLSYILQSLKFTLSCFYANLANANADAKANTNTNANANANTFLYKPKTLNYKLNQGQR